MKSFISVVFLFFISAVISYGTDFRYLGTEHGLTDGEINSIVQDSTGNMWFATWSGLMKYDGYHVELFRPELGDTTSLPDKKIKQLFVDSKDNLWVATSTNLCRYQKFTKSFQTYSFEEIAPNSVNILNLFESNGFLFVNTVEGLYTIPINDTVNEGFLAKHQKVFSEGEELNYYFHYSGSFSNKLILISNNSDGTAQIYFAQLISEAGQTHIEITFTTELDVYINDAEYIPGRDILFFATARGIFQFSLEDMAFTGGRYFRNYDIQRLLHVSNHRMYCSLREPKLLYIDLHTGLTGSFESNPTIPGSLLNNEIHDMHEDFSGNLWIGHQGQGISIMNLYQKKFHTFRRNPNNQLTLSSNTVMCFHSTENEIIVGCRSGGLNIIQKDDRHLDNPDFKRIPLLEEYSPGALYEGEGVWDIEKQSDSLFWVGTDLGLYTLKRTNKNWQLEPFNAEPAIDYIIRKIYIDGNGNIWLGTQSIGLVFLPNPERNRTGVNYRFSSETGDLATLSNNVVLDIFLDSRQRFWVGTNNGLNKLSTDYSNIDLSGRTKPDLKFERFVATRQLPDYLNNNEINCIFENHDGNLWIATQGGGINILNPETNQFSHLTSKDGLPSDDVLGILPDEGGDLWMSTARGLTCYHRFADEPGFTVFNQSDGIQGDVFMINAFHKATDGQMVFGGDNGFTCFYPREIEVNPIEPKVSFTGLKVRNEIVGVGDTIYHDEVLEKILNEQEQITLPHKNNTFSIGVAALHYQDPGNNSVSYILEGYNDTWQTVPASSGFVEFTNLPAGSYTFKAKAVSSDRLKSKAEKTLNISVKPPWYGTWYFLIFVILFGSAFALGIIYILANRQKLIYQKKLDAITIENNENKMMFLTNIAHELRTPLSLIIAPVEDLMKNISVEKQWKNHLQLIHRNSNYLLRLINQMIDFRKLNAGKLSFQPVKADIVRVIKDVVMNFKGHEANRNVNLYLKVPAESVVVSIDVQKIEEVLYNLISNAFKHTPNHRSITVSMNLQKAEHEKAQQQICITVFNEGEVLSGDNRHKIFERFYKVNENSEGAGIGLSFARSLIEMHNGKIEAEPVSERGTAFNVYLPFTDIEVSEAEAEIEPEEAEPVLLNSLNFELNHFENTSNGSHKLLIVEDNEELSGFLFNIFSRYYSCSVAANGNEAWDFIQKNQPSIVISDVIMPEMDGFELCNKMKESKETCHIPIILLTAKNTSEQIVEGYELGADAYITKPFDINLLLSQTSRLIKNRELIREKYKTQNFMVEVENNSTSRDEEFVRKVKQILDTNLSDSEFNVNKLSTELNISTTQLYRKLKVLTGYSPVEFIRILKLQKAYSLLSQRKNTVKEVCYITGFNNLSYFIKCFREQFGVTPAHFRDKGMPEEMKQDVSNIVQL
jgi:signal transduction histidine kinase/DNA-binding response OmpR family regulator/ligand-binding sensor domain-containing protein